MKFTQHYSSSSSNFYTVEAANGKRLMIECGANWKQIQKALEYRLDNVVACLLTHEHKDHSKSVVEVMKSGINVYSSAGTFSALTLLGNRHSFLPNLNKWCNVGSKFLAYPFETNHDAAHSFGYMVQTDGEHLLFATDTSHITQRFNVAFDIIAIECSYDRDILQKRVDENTIDENLAKRLLTSHMEKEETKRYLREFCDLSKCREIHLLHLSRDNIDAEKVRKEIEDEFFINTVNR